MFQKTRSSITKVSVIGSSGLKVPFGKVQFKMNLNRQRQVFLPKSETSMNHGVMLAQISSFRFVREEFLKLRKEKPDLSMFLYLGFLSLQFPVNIAGEHDVIYLKTSTSYFKCKTMFFSENVGIKQIELITITLKCCKRPKGKPTLASAERAACLKVHLGMSTLV